MAIVMTIFINTLFGVAAMMPRSLCMPGSFRRTTGISGGVGILALRPTVVTMLGGMIGAGVCVIRVTSPSVGIRTVMIGMVAVAGCVIITSKGGCR